MRCKPNCRMPQACLQTIRDGGLLPWPGPSMDYENCFKAQIYFRESSCNLSSHPEGDGALRTRRLLARLLTSKKRGSESTKLRRCTRLHKKGPLNQSLTSAAGQFLNVGPFSKEMLQLTVSSHQEERQMQRWG